MAKVVVVLKHCFFFFCIFLTGLTGIFEPAIFVRSIFADKVIFYVSHGNKNYKHKHCTYL